MKQAFFSPAERSLQHDRGEHSQAPRDAHHDQGEGAGDEERALQPLPRRGGQVEDLAVVVETGVRGAGPVRDEELREFLEAHPDAREHRNDVNGQLEDDGGQDNEVGQVPALPAGDAAARSGPAAALGKSVVGHLISRWRPRRCPGHWRERIEDRKSVV